MRKTNRIVKAFVLAAMLSGGLAIGKPMHASDAGMSSNDTYVCAFAQGIIYRAPASVRDALVAIFGAVTGCDGLVG